MSVSEGQPARTPSPELLAVLGRKDWTFDPLRDPKWTPSREDWQALRDAALDELAREREARELADRSRDEAVMDAVGTHNDLLEAEGRVRELEEALRRGATIAEEYDGEGEVSGHVLVEVPLVWLRALREVLRGGPPE